MLQALGLYATYKDATLTTELREPEMRVRICTPHDFRYSFSDRSDPSYLHRGSLTSLGIPSVYLFRHRIFSHSFSCLEAISESISFAASVIVS